ncbi:hypothetical protein SDC9_166068 [bioreactor metagenome]|uniref:Uncharacterized protein n=1 Tax=bioreactor metagenome TaxID=1076179 RepID=A0A645FW86_9ZZZZ
MLMQWIKRSDRFDGIRYRSSLYTHMVQGFGAINIALPVKEFRADGLCKYLTSKIQVSDIAYMDLSSHFEKYREYMDELTALKIRIFSRKSDAVFSVVYIYDIEEVSNNIIETYNSIIDGTIKDLGLALHNINCIAKHLQLMKDATAVFISKAMISAKSYGTEIEEQYIIDTVTSDISEFFRISTRIVHSNMPFYFEKQSLENFELL